MKQAKALREERGKLIHQMKDIMARADENGNLADLDDKQWTELDKRSEELLSQYTRMERQAELEAELEARKLPDAATANDPEKKTDDELKEQYNAVFNRFIRLNRDKRLNEEDLNLLEKRGTADQVGSTDSLGGYLIPEGFSNEIEIYMALYGGMLEAASVMNTGTGNPFPYPDIDDTAATGAYIDQAAADTVGDLTFGVVNFPLTPTITSKIMKVAWELQTDSFFNLQTLIAEMAGARIGRFSNAQFTTGSTANKISGFITDSSSGKTAASASAITRSELVDLLGSIDPEYLKSPKARWMFNNSTLTAIKKMSFGSGDGRPLWVPSMREGAPDTLEGLPYTINQDMASIGSGTKPIAVGDFGKYKIRIAKGITLEMSRERYWDERVTGFAAYARMDGRLVNTSAIKYLTMAV